MLFCFQSAGSSDDEKSSSGGIRHFFSRKRSSRSSSERKHGGSYRSKSVSSAETEPQQPLDIQRVDSNGGGGMAIVQLSESPSLKRSVTHAEHSVAVSTGTDSAFALHYLGTGSVPQTLSPPKAMTSTVSCTVSEWSKLLNLQPMERIANLSNTSISFPVSDVNSTTMKDVKLVEILLSRSGPWHYYPSYTAISYGLRILTISSWLCIPDHCCPAHLQFNMYFCAMISSHHLRGHGNPTSIFNFKLLYQATSSNILRCWDDIFPCLSS